MPRRNIQPVSVAGIEFAALLNETQTYSADIPSYPVETGFSVSDNIALQPMELPLTLLISDTPLTWRGRARSVSETEAMLKELYFKKTTFTVVTPSGTFSNMGITSMQIKKSTDLGFDKEVSLSLQEVPTTETRTTAIPSSYGKSRGHRRQRRDRQHWHREHIFLRRLWWIWQLRQFRRQLQLEEGKLRLHPLQRGVIGRPGVRR